MVGPARQLGRVATLRRTSESTNLIAPTEREMNQPPPAERKPPPRWPLWLFLFLFPVTSAFVLPWYFGVLVFVIFLAGTVMIASHKPRS